MTGAPGVPPRHNGDMPDADRAPWDHQQTPLARAFARAFDRFQAVAGEDADELLATGQDKVLALSGLELDTHELGLYVEALVAAYTDLAMEGDDAHAIAVMRGMAVHVLVAGELHAAERIRAERVRGVTGGELAYHLEHHDPNLPPVLGCRWCAERMNDAAS